MKQLIFITTFILFVTFISGCSEKSSEETKKKTNQPKTSIPTKMAKIDSSSEVTSFTGTVVSYEDMGYPMFQFDLKNSLGELKTVWFNSFDFEGVDDAISKDITGNEMTVELKNIHHNMLLELYFPSKNKSFTTNEGNQDWLKNTKQYKLQARFIEEVIYNGDIYEEWTILQLSNDEFVNFEGVLGVDKSLTGRLAETTYYYEEKEEVVDIKIDLLSPLKEKAIGRSIDLPTTEIPLPEQIAKELYDEVLREMDADEDIFKKFKNEPSKLFLAQRMDLNQDNVWEIIITKSWKNNWCYSHNCPIWIYGKTGKKFKRLLASSFISYEVLEKRNSGYHNFLTVSHGNAVTSYNTVFAFENGQYIKRKCIMETYNIDDKGNETVSYEECN